MKWGTNNVPNKLHSRTETTQVYKAARQRSAQIVSEQTFISIVSQSIVECIRFFFQINGPTWDTQMCEIENRNEETKRENTEAYLFLFAGDKTEYKCQK